MQVAQISKKKGWKRAYYDALYELDPTGLATKLDAAERAIDERLIESMSSGNRCELTELEVAKRIVLRLREEELAG